MARRQGTAPLLSGRSSKPQLRPNDERRQQSETSLRSVRLWLFVLLATFLVFERATVFAVPSSNGLSRSALSHINTTITRNSQPHLSPSANTSRKISPHGPSTTLPRQQVAPLRPANVAYFIQVAENTVNHLPRLLRVIHHDANVYAVHFDLKIPSHLVKPVTDKIRKDSRYDDNVYIMESELITYRGVSMLLNTINAIRLLLEKNQSWDYFINLSGGDYPLLTAHTIRRFLGHQLGLNFFTFAPRRTWDGMAENRLSQVWYDESLTFRRNASIGELTKLAGRNPLVDDRQFDVSHAEAWLISSREFCEFVINGDMSRKMLVAFGYAVDSSEHYFASLAWNNEQFRKSLVPHSMRLIIWLHDGVLSGQHPYFIDETEGEGVYKFKAEISRSVLFFARKFGKPDSDLMDWIDERAKDKEVIAAAANHIVRKISSRETRLAEL